MGEIFISPPSSIAPVTQVRSTLLLSAVAALRDAGLGDAYEQALPAKHRDAILQCVAGVWLPMSAAIAHYETCDSMSLSTETIVMLGRSVCTKVEGTLLGTAVRLAKGVGVSPWTVLPQFPRLWSRACDGGAITGLKIGPKEAHLEIHKASICESRHFRIGLCGVAMAVLEMFCEKAYIVELPGKRPPGGALFRVQWA